MLVLALKKVVILILMGWIFGATETPPSTPEINYPVYSFRAVCSDAVDSPHMRVEAQWDEDAHIHKFTLIEFDEGCSWGNEGLLFSIQTTSDGIPLSPLYEDEQVQIVSLSTDGGNMQPRFELRRVRKLEVNANGHIIFYQDDWLPVNRVDVQPANSILVLPTGEWAELKPHFSWDSSEVVVEATAEATVEATEISELSGR